MGRPMRLELTHVGLLDDVFIENTRLVVISEGLYFDLAQGQMSGVPSETRTHSCRFASLTC